MFELVSGYLGTTPKLAKKWTSDSQGGNFQIETKKYCPVTDQIFLGRPKRFTWSQPFDF
jgi:hypothetical protein